jgi:hypothetical protein
MQGVYLSHLEPHLLGRVIVISLFTLGHLWRRLRFDLEYVETLSNRSRKVDPAAEARRGKSVDGQRLEEVRFGDYLSGGGSRQVSCSL